MNRNTILASLAIAKRKRKAARRKPSQTSWFCAQNIFFSFVLLIAIIVLIIFVLFVRTALENDKLNLFCTTSGNDLVEIGNLEHGFKPVIVSDIGYYQFKWKGNEEFVKIKDCHVIETIDGTITINNNGEPRG